MPGGTIATLALLHRVYRRHPRRQRLHILGRFLSAPLHRIAALIPADSRVLDIGGGHGLLAVLTQARGARQVVVADPDFRKLRPIAGLHLVAGYDSCIRGSFDVITLIDVLYKVPRSDWDALLDRARMRLTAGGLLLVKELDSTAKWKHRWNRLQERMATKAGMTIGESFSYESPDEFIERLRRLGFAEVAARRIDAWYPHAHIIYTARKRA